MKNELEVFLEVPSGIAGVCCESINIEAKSESLTRSTVDLSFEGDLLRLHVVSQDLSSMRAALNTYLRWIIMCCELVDTVN